VKLSYFLFYLLECLHAFSDLFPWSFLAPCTGSPGLVLVADGKANIFVLFVLRFKLRTRWHAWIEVVRVLRLPSVGVTALRYNSVERYRFSLRNVNHVYTREDGECWLAATARSEKNVNVRLFQGHVKAVTATDAFKLFAVLLHVEV